MPLETAPASTQSDGRYRITYVPTGSNAKSVAILNGGTAKPITYGLTPDGWASDRSQAEVPDPRLTMIANLTRPGKITDSLEMTAVVSTTADSADVILAGLATSGVEAQFLVRRAIANDVTHTVGQAGELWTGIVGVRRVQAPTENGVDTVKYKLFITKPTEDVTLVA